MPPVHDWRPALVAADAVVGDHGSVTLYGVALGKPVSLAAHGDEAVPGTAGAELAQVAPRLAPDAELLPQVVDLLRLPAGRRAQYEAVTARAFKDPGTALERLREAVYELLRLPPPSTDPPRPRALVAPANPAAPVTSWRVSTDLLSDRAASGALSLAVRRFPVSVATEQPETARSFSHLAVQPAEEHDRTLVESASVLLGTAPAPDLDAARVWAAGALARLPGSLLAATGVPTGVCLVSSRDGQSVEVSCPDGTFTDPGLAASAVYACLRAGIAPSEIEVSLSLDCPDADSMRLKLRRFCP
ncbi:hypothetical protein [Streptomyces triticagri]|uniref:hypothetical protein n=1 Tax=Streptomyces triticagri TaxID=2293568 RepID=UPI001F30B2C0|nr:hypothetical protein [Streptomyces triticagri]